MRVIMRYYVRQTGVLAEICSPQFSLPTCLELSLYDELLDHYTMISSIDSRIEQ